MLAILCIWTFPVISTAEFSDHSPLFYNALVKSWDLIIVGGGIIGMSLSIALRKRGASVLVVERGEPGREASHAAGGMLVDCRPETAPPLQALATASANMYPEFAHELEAESGTKVDLRNQGTIVFPEERHVSDWQQSSLTSIANPARAHELEPALASKNGPAFVLKERSVDPRALTAAAFKTAKHRNVDFSSGDEVTAINISNGRATGVTTTKTAFASAKVVNCAGAWSGRIAPYALPTRPVKGQMLCLVMPTPDLIRHVIRTPDVYLIPRGDGRLLVGATVEEAGFDKRVVPATVQRLHHCALELVPKLKDAKILEDWAGLCPGTPDALPILGATQTEGYFVATGHFRDGILLAPITSQIMADVIEEREPGHDLSAFSPERFQIPRNMAAK